MITAGSSASSQQLMELEDKYGAHNYHPIPVVLARGEGVYVYDVEGKRYFDFLSAYSAVNQGHCHPRIVAALTEQAHKLTLVSRAFHSDQLGRFVQFVTEYFGYDRVLPMNTGVEAVETALKLCRRWGYDVKKIPADCARIIVVEGNFHGRTLGVISASTDPTTKGGYGPYLPGYDVIPYNDLPALKKALENPHVAGFLVEPIQGEAGVYVPDDGYLKAAYEACQASNVLLLADEVQTGLGRTGRKLCCDHEGVKPDVLILGKALSGGMLPVSAVLASHAVMLTIKPGEHGSTYGGNPLACAVAMESLRVIDDEHLAQRSDQLGKQFRQRMQALVERTPHVKMVRGKGLLNAIVVNDHEEGQMAWDMCMALAEQGLLAKPTHGNIIRFAPPLVMTEEQLDECCAIIERVILNWKAA